MLQAGEREKNPFEMNPDPSLPWNRTLPSRKTTLPDLRGRTSKLLVRHTISTCRCLCGLTEAEDMLWREGGAAWWEGPGVWAMRLCIMTPLLGTWAPLESSFKWTVLISVSQVHVAVHRRDTAPGTRPWGGGHPHSNTWCSGPGAPQCQWLCPAALDALLCASVMTQSDARPQTRVFSMLFNEAQCLRWSGRAQAGDREGERRSPRGQEAVVWGQEGAGFSADPGGSSRDRLRAPRGHTDGSSPGRR